MQYLELGLEIKHDLGQDYWVGVNSSEGEAYITIRLPFDIAALNTPYRKLPESVRLEELIAIFFLLQVSPCKPLDSACLMHL